MKTLDFKDITKEYNAKIRKHNWNISEKKYIKVFGLYNGYIGSPKQNRNVFST